MAYTDEQLEFIQKANNQISDNPVTRLSDITKSTLQRNNFVFDAHCHVFDGNCINVFYLATRMLVGVPEFLKAFVWRMITGERLEYKSMTLTTETLIDQLAEQPERLSAQDLQTFLDNIEEEIGRIEAELEDSTEKINRFRIFPFLARYRNIVRLLRSGRMSDVYISFRDRYAIHSVYNDVYQTDRELVSIVLGMDLNSGWDNSIPKTNAEQNEELGKLPQAYPVLPFLPIDPRRAGLNGDKNLYNIFLKAFDKQNPSFFGVKCYPALGYLPTDSRLKPIFEICAKKNIPVLTHCGGETVSTFDNPIVVNRNGVEEGISLSPRSERARFLNEPREWEEVVSKHKKLKLCLGHFGGVDAWEKPNGLYSNRFSTIIEMMKEFKVYADFSFNIDSEKASKNLVRKMEQSNNEGELLRERTLFGTDFWVILPLSDLIADQRRFVNQIGSLGDNLLKDNVMNYLGLKDLIQ